MLYLHHHHHRLHQTLCLDHAESLTDSPVAHATTVRGLLAWVESTLEPLLESGGIQCDIGTIDGKVVVIGVVATSSTVESFTSRPVLKHLPR